MLNWINSNLKAARETLATEVSKFRNQTFMHAAVNACALIAAADGEITGPEKLKMTGFIKNSPELKIFPIEDILKVFNDSVAKFEFDFHIGQAEALKAIGKLKGKEAESRLIVRLAIAIGGSDGTFDDKERASCRLIALDLGLNPADFDL